MTELLPPDQRIDLSAVPSSMEQMAQRWGSAPTPQAPPDRLRAKPRPRPTFQARPQPVARQEAPRADDASALAREIEPGFFTFGAHGIEKVAAPDPDEPRAHKDALRSFLRSDTPDPLTYARYLPQEAVLALKRARKVYSQWRYSPDTPDEVMRWLRAAGLAYVDKRDDCLTIFARAVRKVLSEGRI